jgi:two-component system invasion response regulator UvrY
MNPIKLIIIEDHTMVREMWKVFLSPEKGFTILADCGSIAEAKQIIQREKADVILLDINLAGDSGFDLVPDIIHYAPESKILVVSMHNILNYAKKLLKMGAMGYVTKNSTNQELETAIRTVASGKKYVCAEVKDLLANDTLYEKSETPGINSLSRRELEVIELLKKGKSSKEIAEHLDISLRTVEVHRYNILHKLNLKNTPALINYINKTEIGI